MKSRQLKNLSGGFFDAHDFFEIVEPSMV